MFLYRIVILRFIKYFGLDELFKKPELPPLLKKKKEKKDYRTRLLIDEQLNFKVSIVMSALSVLIWLSIPLAVLESPTQIFKDSNYQVMYSVTDFIFQYLSVLDMILIIMLFVLFYMSAKLIFEAILRTNVNVSPWVERGTYTMPVKQKRGDDSKSPDRRYYEQYEDLIFNELYKDEYYTLLHEKELGEYRQRMDDEQRYLQYRELRKLVFREREYEIIKNRYLKNVAGNNKDKNQTKENLEDWMMNDYRKYIE